MTALNSRYIVFMFLLFICSGPAQAFKVGLVLDKGGKDDKSFNSSAYEGSKKAEKELGIELKYVEATDTNSIETLHRAFAKKDFDLIIGVGFAQTDAVKKVAAQYPDKKFALVDGAVQASNVRSLLFEEHEGSYLIGVLTALKTKSNKVGFIGGMDIPLIRRFEMGYKAGLLSVNKNIQLTSHFIGISAEAWNNPAKAKELALTQYNNGVDIIFVAAGASGSGAFDAAEEKKKFAIGVDSNQNWMKPGFILTSMLKRVDVAVFETIKLAKENKFTGGEIRFGLKDKGIDYAVDKNNEKLLDAETVKKVEAAKLQIMNGKIKVPDYYKVGKK
jgi:basic membrane protein A and related proteins